MKSKEAIRNDVNQFETKDAKNCATEKVILFLCDKLDEDEKIINMLSASSDRNGVLVATDRKMIFIRKGMLSGYSAHAMMYENLTGAHFDKGILLGELYIHQHGENAKFISVDNKEGIRMANLLENLIKIKKSSSILKSMDDEIFDKIEKLASFRDKGIITEDEFNEKKQDLLDQL